jgi:hypothetical protein
VSRGETRGCGTGIGAAQRPRLAGLKPGLQFLAGLVTASITRSRLKLPGLWRGGKSGHEERYADCCCIGWKVATG